MKAALEELAPAFERAMQAAKSITWAKEGASGEAEIDALQSYTVFHGGVSAASKNPAAAKALAEFLTRPRARAVFKAKGQEPG